MGEIRHPGWADVGLPDQFVQQLAGLQDQTVLESLVYDRVFHLTRGVQFVYHCGVCGYSHKPKKTTDDYGVCGNDQCRSRAIRLVSSHKAMNRTHQPGASGTDEFSSLVLSKMADNHLAYFGSEAEDLVALSWRRGVFHAQFTGGGQTQDRLSSLAIVRASLLVPYLWDGKFDWKEGRFRSRSGHLIPTLAEMLGRGVSS